MTSRVYIPTLSISLTVPYMSVDKYAALMGTKATLLRAWIRRDYVASVRIGKRIMVNVVAESIRAAMKEQFQDKIIINSPVEVGMPEVHNYAI